MLFYKIKDLKKKELDIQAYITFGQVFRDVGASFNLEI